MHLSIYHNAVLTAAILPEPGAITVTANVIIVQAGWTCDHITVYQKIFHPPIHYLT
jgi:hypothetical protein